MSGEAQHKPPAPAPRPPGSLACCWGCLPPRGCCLVGQHAPFRSFILEASSVTYTALKAAGKPAKQQANPECCVFKRDREKGSHPLKLILQQREGSGCWGDCKPACTLLCFRHRSVQCRSRRLGMEPAWRSARSCWWCLWCRSAQELPPCSSRLHRIEIEKRFQLEGTYNNQLVQLPDHFRADQVKACC